MQARKKLINYHVTTGLAGLLITIFGIGGVQGEPADVNLSVGIIIFGSMIMGVAINRALSLRPKTDTKKSGAK